MPRPRRRTVQPASAAVGPSSECRGRPAAAESPVRVKLRTPTACRGLVSILPEALPGSVDSPSQYRSTVRWPLSDRTPDSDPGTKSCPGRPAGARGRAPGARGFKYGPVLTNFQLIIKDHKRISKLPVGEGNEVIGPGASACKERGEQRRRVNLRLALQPGSRPCSDS
eukprot:768032-Hanusia_phi.AAC.5